MDFPEIDVHNFHPKFNSMDGNIDRRSFNGPIKMNGKLPLNVGGRTGAEGKKSFNRWGVNHGADAIVTRCKKHKNGTIVTDESGK